MRDSRLITIGGSVVFGLSLAACGTPQHSDVLMFGTQTKVAFDVSAAPENAQIPEFTLGYKRKEFVWMPLYVNADQPIPGESGGVTRPEGERSKYKGTDPEVIDGGGEVHSGEDTYSVLASFGADFRGDAGVGEVNAGAGLAQYFATGHAARKLAESGGDLVNTQAPSQQTLKQAIARADAAEKMVIELSRKRGASEIEHQERVEKLLDAISGLPDEQAIALATNPPVPSAEAEAVISAIDPGGSYKSNGGAARQVLKTRAALDERNEENLAKWEAAVKGAQ